MLSILPTSVQRVCKYRPCLHANASVLLPAKYKRGQQIVRTGVCSSLVGFRVMSACHPLHYTAMSCRTSQRHCMSWCLPISNTRVHTVYGENLKVPNSAPTGIWTRIAGFKVQSANHYTIRASSQAITHKHQSIPINIVNMLLSSLLVAMANEITFLGPEDPQPFLIVNLPKIHPATLLTAFTILLFDRGQRR